MQCGLCAIVAGLFRRAMCIAGSRRGSGESCYQDYQDYQELATDAKQASVKPEVTATEGATTISAPNALTATTTTTTSTTASTVLPVSTSQLLSERRSAEVTVDSDERNAAVFIRISEDAVLATSGTTSPAVPQVDDEFLPMDDLSRRLSDGDKILLESLDIGRFRLKHTGRFLTMHKRRRKRLTTRSLNQEQAILDDIFHGLVQCVLQKAGNWRFNAFTLETVTGGRSLPVLCVHLFHWYGLFQHFNLDVVTVWKLFTFIEDGYHSTNPYHNSVHATDVTQAMHCFLQEEKIRTHLTSLEIMASLIAAVTHDLDHPGVNQPFLVATSNHLAALYQNTSVLENHHWRSAIGCLLDSGVSEQLAPDVRPELQRHISSLILATDITRQQEFLTRFKRYLDDNLLDMRRPEDRHFILQIALKCADISNPCRPWDISLKWSYKVCEEFFRQGDYERRLNLPVTPLCDRHTTSIPKIQVGFFKFVVTPLYEEWHRFLGDGLSVSLMKHLRANQSKWEALIAEETAEETETEISELDEAVNDIRSEISSDEGERDDDVTRSSDLLIPLGSFHHHQQQQQQSRQIGLPGKLVGVRLVGRRHSVPISVTNPSSFPTSSITSAAGTGRRESLPSEHQGKPKSLYPFRSDDKLLLDDGNKLSEPVTLSPLSSRSSILQTSTNLSTTTINAERPVSAENLLPDTNITSITSSVEASRLSSVLQNQGLRSGVGNSGDGGGIVAGNTAHQTKQLTRQQTFPPLHPCARMRYMSTTAEMTQCYISRTLTEGPDSCSSNSSGSPTKERVCTGGGRCGTPDVDSPKRCKSRDLLAPVEFQNYKRKGSTITDYVRQKTEFAVDQRRHSVQSIRHDDFNSSNVGALKTKLKRPSSAQESDPARIFYALTTTPKNTGNGNGTSSDGNGNSYCYGNSSNIQTTASQACHEDGSRRHSTPMSENRTSFNETHSGRRFTTIPISSEISTHKVFFIGSPPDSPPRFQSTSCLSDGIKRGSVGGDGAVSGNSDCVTSNSAAVTCDSNVSSCNSSGDIGSTRDKRDMVDCVREKAVNKVAKVLLDSHMKENVDPRGEEFSKNALVRKGSQGWARRRGSAPVGLLSRIDDFSLITAAIPPSTADQHSRRGSVPTDISTHQGGGASIRLALGPRDENFSTPRRASLPHEATLRSLMGNVLAVNIEQENYAIHSNNNININNSTSMSNNNGLRSFDGSLLVPVSGMPSPRRGSVPADISELRRDLFGRSGVNGKPRNRKKVLKRRSSGGPEMFSVVCSGFGVIDTSESGGVSGGSNGGDDDAGTGGSGNSSSGVGAAPIGGLGGSNCVKWKRDSLPDTVIKRRGSLPIEMVAVTHAGSPMSGVRRSSLWRL